MWSSGNYVQKRLFNFIIINLDLLISSNYTYANMKEITSFFVYFRRKGEGEGGREADVNDTPCNK
jgi:hypothetical protein